MAIKRRKPSIDDLVIALCQHDRKQAERAQRERAISQLAQKAGIAKSENFWNRIEVVTVITILAVVELFRLGGAA